MNNRLPFTNASELFDALVVQCKMRRVLVFSLPYGGKADDSVKQLAKSQRAEITERCVALLAKPDIEDSSGRRTLATLCQFDYFDLIPKSWLTLEQLSYRCNTGATALEWLCSKDKLSIIPDIQQFHSLSLSKKIAWRTALAAYVVDLDVFNLIETPWENLQPVHSWGQL